MESIRAVATYAVARAARSRPMDPRLEPGSQNPVPGHDHERGQGLAEYSLILSGIAVLAIVSLALVGGVITGMFWEPIDAEFGRVLFEILGIGDPPDIPT